MTGIDKECIPGMKGGNVLRKFTRVKLSVRIPPSMDPKAAQQALKKACEAKPTPWYDGPSSSLIIVICYN